MWDPASMSTCACLVSTGCEKRALYVLGSSLLAMQQSAGHEKEREQELYRGAGDATTSTSPPLRPTGKRQTRDVVLSILIA